jgi:hypothetical protein
VNTMVFVISIIVIFITVFSLFSFSQNLLHQWQKAREFTKNKNPIRQLSLDEVNALESTKPQNGTIKKFKVTNRDVFVLEGEILLRKLYVNHHGSSSVIKNYSINDIEIILPLNSEYCISEGPNSAEVVFIKKKAIVVQLNKKFDIISAAKLNKNADDNLLKWKIGLPKTKIDSVINLSYYLKHLASEFEKSTEAPTIIEQRDETIEEAESRRFVGWEFSNSFLILIAYICFYVGNSPYQPHIQTSSLLVLGLIFIAISFWLFFKKPRPIKLEKVNIVEGEIVCFKINEEQIITLLGGRIHIEFMFEKVGQLILDTQNSLVEIGIRVNDFSFVSFNDNFNMGLDFSSKKQFYWGRELTMAMTGVLGFIGFNFLIFQNGFSVTNINQEKNDSSMHLINSSCPFLGWLISAAIIILFGKRLYSLYSQYRLSTIQGKI